MLCPAHKEVLRLRYDDYANWASEDHLIRVEALLKPTGRSPIMAVANIPLSTPELLVQVRPSVGPGRCLGLGEDKDGARPCTFTPQLLLLLQVPGKAATWRNITAYISFSNPLPVPLRFGVFTVEGAGLLAATQIPLQ